MNSSYSVKVDTPLQNKVQTLQNYWFIATKSYQDAEFI